MSVTTVSATKPSIAINNTAAAKSYNRALRNVGFLSPDLTSMPSLTRQSVSALTTPSCGSKHDNLLRAKVALDPTLASIPPFFGFTDAQMKSLLSPKTKDLWEKVCTLNDVLNKTEKRLSTELVWSEKVNMLNGIRDNAWKKQALLQELETSIQNDILSAKLPLSEKQREMLQSYRHKTLIVRSSSNEDTADSINAGGNETVAGVDPSEEGLKKALAKVIASYFSPASLKNRSAFTDPYKEMPSCSALVMIQIEETRDDLHPVVSGVMMSHKTAWFRAQEAKTAQISASFGFGAGVASKTPCDEWVLTDDQWYPTIRSKAHRTAFLSLGETKQIGNPPELRDAPCLSKMQLERLQEVGKQLEKEFGQPQDIEFIFRGDELYVVQTRAIHAPEIKNPTFLDLRSLAPTAHCLQGTTLVSGGGQALKLSTNNILFAKNLEDADQQFRPGLHKAVLIYTPPASSNTHEEVNFSSQRPPIPCFLLSPDAWNIALHNESSTENVYLCPQRGIVAISDSQIPIQKGLLQHPARLLLSVDETMPPYQSALSNQAFAKRLKTYIETIEEQVSLGENGTLIASSLKAIEKELTQFFSDVSTRFAAKTAKLQQVSQKLHTLSMSIFHAMQSAAEKNEPTLLSFHAGALKQLLQQTGRQIVGAHSLVGLDEATKTPPHIEAFVKTHSQSPLLCELALLSKKAWDLPLQQKWLAFLANNQKELHGEQGKTLLATIKEFDQLGMAPLWFSIHLSEKAEPPLQDTKGQEFLRTCLHFTREFSHLAERVQRVQTEAELSDAWKSLQQQTEQFFHFSSHSTNKGLLQTLQLSKLSHDLIQLWDAQIKIVKTSRLLPEKETESLYKQRIIQFAEFGLKAMKNCAIATDMEPHHQDQLRELLTKIAANAELYKCPDRPFSVQHWIVPKATALSDVPNDEARFTIVHQNLLRAASLKFTPDQQKLLPAPLAQAVQTFTEEATCETKRFAFGKAMFVSILEDSASVTINIPLNLHSFVLTISQNKGSDAIEFDAYWKGSDNNQGDNLPFIQLLCHLSGISLKSYAKKGTDLRAVFSATDARQVKLVSRAIDDINFMSLHSKDYLRTLIRLLHPKKLNTDTLEDFDEETKETRAKILDAVWKQLVDTGAAPGFLNISRIFNRKYLERKGLFPMVIARVIEEVEGKRAPSTFSEEFFDMALKTLPNHKQKELIWLAITKLKKHVPIPKSFEKEIFRRLYLEEPARALEFMTCPDLLQIQTMMGEILKAGAPKCPEQAALVQEFCERYKYEKIPIPEEWSKLVDRWKAKNGAKL